MAQQIQKRGLSPLISMVRPANSVMVGFAVIVGMAVTSNSYQNIFTFTALLGFLTGFFISSFSMVSNDIYDLEVDRINQPNRPLPSQSVSINQAKVFCWVLLVLGLLVSIRLGVVTFVIAGIFALIGWFYNYRGKAMGIFGNSLVALSLAIPYIYGSVALGNYSINLGYLLALTSFLAGMGREVLKGVADVEGDRLRKIRTVAISYGIHSARILSSAFFLIAVASSAFPIVLGLLGRALPVYLALITITDAIFVYLTYRVMSLRNEKDALKLKTIALGGMMFGLVAYLISGLAV